jgi:hypothetical protein
VYPSRHEVTRVVQETAHDVPRSDSRTAHRGRAGGRGGVRSGQHPAERAKLTKEELAAKQRDANEKYLPHWTVADGVLRYDGKGQSLQTSVDYGDFELLVDWKIGPKGDTGIYLRGTPQVQIWDNPEGSGGLYNNKINPRQPLAKADKPVGEWNTFRIVMRGDKVSVWLNGTLVVDNVTMENYWQRDQPIAARGPIELQHHGNPIEFKNIYIRKLD